MAVKPKKTAKKPPAKKAAPKKPVGIKKATKPAPKKTAVKKPTPKKSVKKVAAKKPVVKKAAPKKSTVKKPVVKKAAPKKAIAKKPVSKKTAPVKPVSKPVAAQKKHVIKRVKAGIAEPAANMPQIIPIDALIDHAVKTEDPMMRFDKKEFKKATSKVDPRHNMPISSKSKRSKMPSAKKPLWRK